MDPDTSSLVVRYDRGTLFADSSGPSRRRTCIRCIQSIHMGTISARVPDELEDELEAYLEDENLDRSTAVRKLLADGLRAWRRERALDQLAADRVTFTRAAELADMSVWDFAQLAKERDITWVSGEHLEDDLEAL